LEFVLFPEGNHGNKTKCPQRKSFWGHLKKYGIQSNPHTVQELKDSIRHAVVAIKITTFYRVYLNMIRHAVAAIKITMLHRVQLNMIRRAQQCIDAGGNHFQHLATVLISVFTLCYKPGLLFRGPFCIKEYL